MGTKRKMPTKAEYEKFKPVKETSVFDEQNELVELKLIEKEQAGDNAWLCKFKLPNPEKTIGIAIMGKVTAIILDGNTKKQIEIVPVSDVHQKGEV